ncbi:MAG: hypothetical protein PHS73_04620 [Candidatus Peribacteraceae bacterium]|nr:hypothetical protein [Candidatus Peribacteraceae bacterium]
MSIRDDEDIVGASLSSQERFTRADQGRKEALKREVEAHKGKKVEEADMKKLKGLKTQVDLKKLEAQVAGQQNDETKRAAAAQEAKKHETFGTKTHKQEEEEQVQTAQKKEKPEDLMRKEEAKEQAQQQAQEEYQQQVG